MKGNSLLEKQCLDQNVKLDVQVFSERIFLRRQNEAPCEIGDNNEKRGLQTPNLEKLEHRVKETCKAVLIYTKYAR
jgi:hypothetical protein